MTHGTAFHADIDSPGMRAAGRELLSLALMDARNHTLHLLGAFEQALGPALAMPRAPRLVPPAWCVGHVGWLAEAWIGRNPQRGQGAACPADAPWLASIEPQADSWFDPLLVSPSQRWALALPPLHQLRAYLLDTLETTLELLDKAQPGEAGLYFFRMALFHEDLRGEQLVALAQHAGVPLALAVPPGLRPREPLPMPATHWRLGWDGPGFALDVEQGRDEVAVPEFEIDAQPVSWAQYVEFIDAGGYDRQDLWDPRGWQWLLAQAESEGRRGPRYVEQIGVVAGAVLQALFGKPTRMGGLQNVTHVSWWEADAYARWAGRRLPTEVEWEIAAHQATRRGFRWGEVREWTAGTLRPWPGFAPAPWAVRAELDAGLAFGHARVLRGASWASRARMKHPKARWWALPECDEAFVGFRTCAV
jgi:ergothioneine biosynthesis protein EgtB